jgi:superkiller protein 3
MKRGWLWTAVILTTIVLALSGCANKYVTSGKIAMNGKNYDKAIEDFNKALEQNPNNGEAHFYLAQCYREKEEYDKMLPHIVAAETLYTKKAGKMEDLRKETWTKLFEAGKANATEEKWEEARDDFELAIRVYPSRYEAYSNTGFVWQHLGDNDSAYSYYSRAYEIAPDELLVLENFASLCYNMKKYDEAEDLYLKILAKDPKHASAMARLGDIYGQKEEFDKAVNYYTDALEIENDNCALWFNLGVLYFQKIKDNDNAINAFSRTVDLCPDDLNAFINLAVAYISAERFDEAVEKLEVFVEDNPDDCTGWDLYSQALLRKGMRKQAQEAYKKYEECSEK